jgi:hypothetical protein
MWGLIECGVNRMWGQSNVGSIECGGQSNVGVNRKIARFTRGMVDHLVRAKVAVESAVLHLTDTGE